ncbi:hypothetical protein [Micromonospora sp. RV43]|uniref:hypothetical protein n=1 Tax=Micromonospora sp. RV43 TaxID=1661387 RepID=UPI00064BBBB1|nr:hypothetical protein [Micromonospora sp. RV43]
MPISRVDDQEVMPAGAQPGCTVPGLTGVVDGDFVLHLFAMLSTTATVAEPVPGLTVRGDASSGSSLSARLRSRAAAAEPATYDWGLGTSVKNAAWAAAYRGVDPAAPVAAAQMVAGVAGATQTTPPVDVPNGGWLVYGVATRHTPGAAGVASWSSSAPSEARRANLATNAGSADITMAVFDSAGSLSAATGVTRTLTSSMSEQNAVVFAIVLRPAAAPIAPFADPTPGLPVF